MHCCYLVAKGQMPVRESRVKMGRPERCSVFLCGLWLQAAGAGSRVGPKEG